MWPSKNRALLLAWSLVGLSAAALLLRLPSLPESVPLFRSFAAVPTEWAPRSLLTVLRLALLGAAQVGVASVLARVGWARFWSPVGLAAGAKTALESLGFCLLGTAWFAPLGLPLTLAVYAVLLVFAVVVARRWKQLGPAPEVPPGTLAMLAAFAGLWAFAAARSIWWGLLAAAAVLGLALADRILLELEERGCLYYRKRKAQLSATGSALMEFHGILEPRTRHVTVAKQRVDQRREADDPDGKKEEADSRFVVPPDHTP